MKQVPCVAKAPAKMHHQFVSRLCSKSLPRSVLYVLLVFVCAGWSACVLCRGTRATSCPWSVACRIGVKRRLHVSILIALLAVLCPP